MVLGLLSSALDCVQTGYTPNGGMLIFASILGKGLQFGASQRNKHTFVCSRNPSTKIRRICWPVILLPLLRLSTSTGPV